MQHFKHGDDIERLLQNADVIWMRHQFKRACHAATSVGEIRVGKPADFVVHAES